jgi:hypothetical protein
VTRSDGRRAPRARFRAWWLPPAVGVAAVALVGCSSGIATSAPSGTGGSPTDWQDDFQLADRTLSDTGESKYFILRPGFQLVLASSDERLTITVLDETKRIGEVTTRVVLEAAEKNGQVVEIARNFFAIDQKTGDVFYFAEEVDDYERGKVVGHGGTWAAFADGNRPGLIMPGAPRVGMKYYQEVAPGRAMDRGEVVSTTARCGAPAGDFENCLITRETTPLEPSVIEQKIYAPGIGLLQDNSLKLVGYGYVKK